jgi:hypothetical protein
MESIGSLRDFHGLFETDRDCYRYLYEMKWKDGFTCSNCGSQREAKAFDNHSKRCGSCFYEESATAKTVFHKLKFSVRKAFEIIFWISHMKKGISTLMLSEEIGLRYHTCLRFRRKVQLHMQSSRRHPLKGEVHVDETAIGGADEMAQGRSKGDKKLTAIAVEVNEQGKMKRAYAQRISDYSSLSLQSMFFNYIDTQANIITDEWSGYKPLKKHYPNLRQKKSNNGSNFKELHIHIFNLKAWIRGTHHHFNERYIQHYFNEYYFRFNRRGSTSFNFERIMNRLLDPIVIKYSDLLKLCALSV